MWNICMDVRHPWTIWRFLLSRPREPRLNESNINPSCLAVVNPTQIGRGTPTLSNKAVHQRGCVPACLYYEVVGLCATGSCALYWCGRGLSEEPQSHLLRLAIENQVCSCLRGFSTQPLSPGILFGSCVCVCVLLLGLLESGIPHWNGCMIVVMFCCHVHADVPLFYSGVCFSRSTCFPKMFPNIRSLLFGF